MEDYENYHVEPVEKPVDRKGLANAMVSYLPVYGMGSQRCAMQVRNRVHILDGVIKVETVFERGYVAVTYDPHRLNIERVIMGVAQAGNDGRHNYQAQFIREEIFKEKNIWEKHAPF